MDRTMIDPDLRAAAEKLRVPPVDRALMRWIIRTAMKIMPVPKVDGVRINTVRVGDTRLRIYQPTIQRTTAGMLWIHGGDCVPKLPRRWAWLSCQPTIVWLLSIRFRQPLRTSMMPGTGSRPMPAPWVSIQPAW
jgi:hypothetical protein